MLSTFRAPLAISCDFKKVLESVNQNTDNNPIKSSRQTYRSIVQSNDSSLVNIAKLRNIG